MSDAPDIVGQYLFYINYNEHPHDIHRTGLVKNRSTLLNRKRVINRISPHNDRDLSEAADLSNLYARIRGYTNAAINVMRSMSYFPAVQLTRYLEDGADNQLELVRSRKRSRLYVSKSLDVKSLRKEVGLFGSNFQNGYAISNAIFSGLVSTFDELLGLIIKFAIRSKPEILNGIGKNVAYSEIVSAGDFSQLQSEIIDSMIESIMMDPRSTQIEWLEKYFLDFKLKEIWSEYNKFIEINERRNIYVHNDGYPSKAYVNRIKSATGKAASVDFSKRLRLTSSYFNEASDILTEALIIISQGVTRKILKSNRDAKSELDTGFAHAIYELIEEKRYESAARVGEIVVRKYPGIGELGSRMATINWAIAEKKRGEIEKCNKILDTPEWTASRDEFRLCVSAVKGDIDSVCSYIPKLKDSDWITPESYFEWPAFDGLRDKSEFWKALHETYGEHIKFEPEPAIEPEDTTLQDL